MRRRGRPPMADEDRRSARLTVNLREADLEALADEGMPGVVARDLIERHVARRRRKIGEAPED